MERNRTFRPFYALTPGDREKYAGKWVVAYGGKVVGVGNSLQVALRRAKLPEGEEPELVTQVPTREIWLL